MPSARSQEVPTARPRVPMPPSFAPRPAARLPSPPQGAPREQIAPSHAARRQQSPPHLVAPLKKIVPGARPSRSEDDARGARTTHRPTSVPARRGVSALPPIAEQPPRRRRKRGVRAVLVVVLVGLAGAGIGWGAGLVLGSDEPPQALDPVVQERFDLAASAAGAKGVELRINSGWRTPGEQQVLFDDAVAVHGSEREAARWVLPPEKSAHVQGTAIDVGPATGAAWLAKRSGTYGLCRVYLNEPWHFEPLVEPGGTCPPVLADATK